MHILIATGIYPPEIGGPATYAALLERELPAQGFTVTVLPFSTVRGYPKIVRHCLYFFKVLQVSREVTVIYALDPVSVGLPAALAARLRRKPFMIRLGGDYAWEQFRLRYDSTVTLEEFWTQGVSLPFFISLLRKVQSFVTRQAEVVISPSNYLKSVIVQWGISPTKITVINSVYNPVGIEEQNLVVANKEDARFPVITTAGRLVPWKGFVGVLEAVAILKKTFPDVRLIIAGEGEQRDVLKSVAANLGISKSVEFTGKLTQPVLSQRIISSDVFILNTQYEGLSHQLIEVMNLGVPIVTTSVGGNPELITHNKNGLLVSYNNVEEMVAALTLLITDRERSQSFVRNAKETVKNFSQEKMLQSLVGLLKQYE